jgi:hypothetical protein
MLKTIATNFLRRATKFNELAFVKGLDYRYDDVDSLSVSYPFTDFEDLSAKLERLEIRLVVRPPDASDWPPPIKDFPHYAQPGELIVFNQAVHALVALKSITIAIRGENHGHLSLAQLRAAKELDASLANLGIPKNLEPLTMGQIVREPASSEA